MEVAILKKLNRCDEKILLERLSSFKLEYSRSELMKSELLEWVPKKIMDPCNKLVHYITSLDFILNVIYLISEI